MAGLAATPQVTAHSVLPVQVVKQSPSHLTLQLAESAHVIVLALPTWILQVALVLQATVDSAPSLKSQFELAVQVTALASPPCPLHSEESLQVTVSSPAEVPLHFAELVQLSEQSPSPHSVLQSAPATQAQAESVHRHPVPIHVGSAGSPPHAEPANAIDSRAMEPSFMGAIVRQPLRGRKQPARQVRSWNLPTSRPAGSVISSRSACSQPSPS